MNRLLGEPFCIVKGDLRDQSRWRTLEDLYSSEQGTQADAAISWAKDELNEHLSCPSWERLEAMCSLFRYLQAYQNNFAIFRYVVAENFFREFPEGEIWHLTVHSDYDHKIFRTRQASITKKYGQSGEGHSSSGLDIVKALTSAGVSIPLSMTFPYIWGASARTDRAVVIFLPNRLLDTWEKALDPTRILQRDAEEVYEGTAQASVGIGVKISNFTGWDGKRFVADDFKSYLAWYLEHLDCLCKFINEVEPDEDAYLLSLSMSRIIYETLIAVTTHIAFTRNQFLYAILDKYANISKGLSLCPRSMNEAKVWTSFLSVENLQNRIFSLVRTIEGLGGDFSMLCDDLREDLQTMMDYEDSLRSHFSDVSFGDWLRIVRNSTHGYLFGSERKRRILLSSSGEMSVFLDGAPILLWNAFISDPRTFLARQ